MNETYNQMNGIPPRYKEDGGRGAGFVTGSIMGAAAMGSFHKWGNTWGTGLYNKSLEYAQNPKTMEFKNADKLTETELTGKRMRRTAIGTAGIGAGEKLNSLHGKMKGAGGWGKAGAYAGAVLLGGVLGSMLDDPNS